MEALYGIPAVVIALSATNDHRSDFGIAHVYYIGLVLDTYKANSLLFGNAGGAGFHSVLTLEFTGISV